MKSKFDYHTQDYFPNTVKFIGILILLAGLIGFSADAYLVSMILLTIGFVIFTSKYGIEIDLKNRQYLDYLSFFGIKKGEKRPFTIIESIYITKGKKTTTMQLRGHKTNVTKDEYNGYINFSEDDKVHLLSSESKDKVSKLLHQMSTDMEVELEDYSNED